MSRGICRLACLGLSVLCAVQICCSALPVSAQVSANESAARNSGNSNSTDSSGRASGTSLSEQSPRTTYFAPDGDGTPRPLINVPLERIQAALDGMPSTTQQPPPFQINKLQIHGTVGDQVAELQVELDVHVLPVDDSEEPSWTALPLRFHDASLLDEPEHTGAGQLYVVFDQQAGYQGWLRHTGAGEHHLSLKLAVPLTRAADATQLRFFPPIANRSQVQLTVPADELTANAENARNLRVTSEDHQTTTLTAEDLRNQVILTWRQGETDAQQPTSLDVRGDIRVQIDGPGVIRSTVALEVQSYDFGRPIEQFTIRLPPNTKIVAGNQPDFRISPLANSEGADGAGRALVQVKLDKPSSGARIRFTTQTVEQAAKLGPLNVANYEVINAIRQSGRVSLLTNEEWLVYWNLGPSVRRVANADTLEGTSNRRLLASFEYFGQPCRLDVEVKPQDTTVSVRPIYRMHVADDQIRMETQLNYKLRGARVSFLDIALNGWRLDDVGPPGAVENDDFTSHSNEGTIRLRLTQASAGDLRLTLNLSRPLAGDGGTVRLSLPWATADRVNGGQLIVSSDPQIVLTFHPDEMEGILSEPGYAASVTNGLGVDLDGATRQGLLQDATPARRVDAADGDAAESSGSANTNGVAVDGAVGGGDDTDRSNGLGNTASASIENGEATSERASRSTGGSPLLTRVPGASQSLAFFRLLNDRTLGEIVFDYEMRSQAIDVEIDTDVQLTLDQARVAQRINYRVEYEPLARITLDVPRELYQLIATPRTRELVELRIDGRPLELARYLDTSDQSADGRDLVALSLALPTARLGLIRLEMSFPWALRSSPMANDVIPLVVPREGNVTANIATLRTTGALRIEPAGDNNWIRDDELANASSLQAIGLTSPVQPERISLQVSKLQEDSTDTAPQSATVVDLAWFQTWLSYSKRRDRAVFRLTGGASAIQIDLPKSAERTICLVDRQPVEALQENQQLTVPMPASSGNEQHTVELSIEFSGRPSLGRMNFRPPRIREANGPGVWFWQLLLPESEHLLWTDPTLTSANRWQRDGWLWARQQDRAQESLERSTGASRQMPPPQGLNRYLFSSFGRAESFAVRTIARSTLVLAASSIAFGVALLVVYVPRLRHPGLLMTLAVALFTGGWIYPDIAVLWGQASILGLLLGVLSLITYLIVQRWQPTPVSVADDASRRREAGSSLTAVWGELSDDPASGSTNGGAAAAEQKVIDRSQSPHHASDSQIEPADQRSSPTSPSTPHGSDIKHDSTGSSHTTTLPSPAPDSNS